jgi:hypothetical protein
MIKSQQTNKFSAKYFEGMSKVMNNKSGERHRKRPSDDLKGDSYISLSFSNQQQFESLVIVRKETLR